MSKWARITRTIGLALVLCALLGGVIGCAASEKSTASSPGYWKRVFNKWGDDMHEFRVDFDRIFWDLEDRPIEDY
jgi:hypothetical protein